MQISNTEEKMQSYRWYTLYVVLLWGYTSDSLVISAADPDQDPYNFLGSGSGSVPQVSRIRIHKLLSWAQQNYLEGGIELRVPFVWVLLGPTDKENEVKMYKKHCLRYITSLKRERSGSVSNSQIRIRLESRIRIRIKVKSRNRIRKKGLDPQHSLSKNHPPHTLVIYNEYCIVKTLII